MDSHSTEPEKNSMQASDQDGSKMEFSEAASSHKPNNDHSVLNASSSQDNNHRGVQRAMMQIEVKTEEPGDVEETMSCDACNYCQNTQNLFALRENKEKLVILTGMVMSSSLSLQDATRLYNTSSEMFACLEHVKLSHKVLSKLLDENSDYFLKKNTLLYEISVEIRRRPITLSSHRKHCKTVFEKLFKAESKPMTGTRRRIVTRSSFRQLGEANYIKKQGSDSSLKCAVCGSKEICELRKVQAGNEKLMVLIGMVMEHRIDANFARAKFDIDTQFFACDKHIVKAHQKIAHTDCFNIYMHVQSISLNDVAVKAAWKCYQHFCAKYHNLSLLICEEPDDGAYPYFTDVKRCCICQKGRIDDQFVVSTKEDFTRIFGFAPTGETIHFCSKHLRDNNVKNNNMAKIKSKENMECDESWNEVLSEHSYCLPPTEETKYSPIVNVPLCSTKNYGNNTSQTNP